jgi:hypothetical protein
MFEEADMFDVIETQCIHVLKHMVPHKCASFLCFNISIKTF